MEGEKTHIYFVSDLHAGIPTPAESFEREKRFIAWMERIKDRATALYFLGDIFDFWFEYKRVVPRGYTRLLGKMAELADRGTELHFFTGNHDLWTFDYLPTEIGMTLHRSPLRVHFFGKKYLLGHGDGLGPGDKGYKFMKRIFTAPLSQWLFAKLHPNTGIRLADHFSAKSRKRMMQKKQFHSIDNEWLYQYCLETLRTEHFDHFIFGHRHLPLNIEIPADRSPSGKPALYQNTGDWINHFSYIELTEAEGPTLRYFKQEGDRKNSSGDE